MKRRTIFNSLVAAPLLASGVARANQNAGPKIRIAVIGLGATGSGCLAALAKLPEFEIVALCDVDGSRLAKAAEQHPQARKFADFREVLNGKETDAVVVTTPSHWSATVAAMAISQGLLAYVETPLAHTVEEVKILGGEAKRRGGPVLFSANPLKAAPALAPLREQVDALGKLHSIKITTRPTRVEVAKAEPSPPPASLNYDTWLGPAPVQPFMTNRFHGTWKYFWDFGGGYMTGHALRLWDLATSLQATPDANMNVPIRISCDGGICYPSAGETPDTQEASLKFGDGIRMSCEIKAWNAKGATSLVWLGEHGMVELNDSGLYARKWEGERQTIATTTWQQLIDPSANLKRFGRAIMQQEKISVDAELAGTLVAQLSNAAFRASEKLPKPASFLFSPDTMTFDSPEANAYLKREYRQEFKLMGQV